MRINDGFGHLGIKIEQVAKINASKLFSSRTGKGAKGSREGPPDYSENTHKHTEFFLKRVKYG